MTPRELLYLVLTYTLVVLVSSTYAIVAAFFQVHAVGELRLERADTARIFAAFSLAQLVVSPASGPLASRFGRRRVLVCGVLAVCSSTIAFGLAPDVLTDRSWLVLAFTLLRLVQGGGVALAVTCIYAELTDSFPSAQGTVIGIASGCNGLGWTAGPPLGGLLFVLGGFRLPFVTPLAAALPRGAASRRPPPQAPRHGRRD
eukprot:COSAG04_NODE_815_length_10088_cov_12.515667_11_plen_201_part_00